jgi:hypothetical protein
VHCHRLAAPWVTAERSPAPDRRLILFPRFPSSLSLFRDHHRVARRPWRLTLGVAAATAAAIAGASVGATHPVSAASSPSAISHAGAVRASGHTGAISLNAASGPAPSGRDPVPARQPHHPPGRARLVSRQRAQRQTATPGRPAAPYLIYDSVIPSAIPPHEMIATYATGPYAVSPPQMSGRGPVMWIDVQGTDYAASALDVEPGDATPSVAASWAWHRLNAYPNSIAHIYTMLSEWPSVQAACATLPAWMQARIRWWIADPTGVPHIVPGSDATQWYWGSSYDISTATPRF